MRILQWVLHPFVFLLALIGIALFINRVPLIELAGTYVAENPPAVETQPSLPTVSAATAAQGVAPVAGPVTLPSPAPTQMSPQPSSDAPEDVVVTDGPGSGSWRTVPEALGADIALGDGVPKVEEMGAEPLTANGGERTGVGDGEDAVQGPRYWLAQADSQLYTGDVERAAYSYLLAALGFDSEGDAQSAFELLALVEELVRSSGRTNAPAGNGSGMPLSQ